MNRVKEKVYEDQNARQVRLLRPGNASGQTVGLKGRSTTKENKMTPKATLLFRGPWLTLSLGVCLSVAAHAQLSNPSGIAFDSAGNPWVTVTEGSNHPCRLACAFGDLYVENATRHNVTVCETSARESNESEGDCHEN
jgi:hypothetical protein